MRKSIPTPPYTNKQKNQKSQPSVTKCCLAFLSTRQGIANDHNLSLLVLVKEGFFNELVIPSSAVVWSSSSSCIWIIVPRGLYIFVKVSQRVIRGWGGFSLTAAFYNLLPLQSFIPCGVSLLLAQTRSKTCLCSDHTELAAVHHRYQGMASMCSSDSHLSPHPPPQPPRRSVH